MLPVFRSPGRLKRIAHKLRRFRFLIPPAIRRQLKREIRRAVSRTNAATQEGNAPVVSPAVTAAAQPVPLAGVTEPTGAGLNVVGYFEVESGVGESARLSIQAATAAGLPTTECDITPDSAERTAGRRSGRAYTTDNPHAVVLMHVNADQTPHVRGLLGEAYFAKRHTVGVWHWELPRFPDRWLPAFDCVDEIWAPSRFIHDTLAVCSAKPIHRIPHAIRFSPSPAASRRDFGLPDGDFLFLMMYDVRSYSPRKNPEGAIAAFRRAFGNAPGVSLVIKVNDSFADEEPDEHLQELVGDAKNIHLVAEKLDRQRTYDLLSVCDSVVSLHRSEGFGLVLAEAMYLGKPVVATGWSGNMEFMTPSNSCLVDYRPVVLDRDIGPYERGQVWAEPDLDCAAELMKQLATDAERSRQVGAAGQQTIRTQLSPERIGDLYRARIQAIVNGDSPTLRIRSAA
jgi:glycosyltransferase involved in cell wall biosynthesis